MNIHVIIIIVIFIYIALGSLFSKKNNGPFVKVGKKVKYRAFALPYLLTLIVFFHLLVMQRLRRVIWNPWQSNGKLRNMKNKSFEVLCHKQIRNARRGSKEKSAMKQFFMSVMSATFGALPEVQFIHDICHFKD